MLPTMQSLMGVETIYPAIGRDLTRAECAQNEGRATMQFGNNFADMGNAWLGEQAKFNKTDTILSSVSVGLRLYSPRSNHKSVIHMDIAKPFVTTEKVDAWEWRLQINPFSYNKKLEM
jgi:hypothetical protein